MLERIKFLRKIFSDNQKDQNCEELLKTKLAHLNLSGYTYTPDEAVEELGLDEELVNQLVDDYVAQIIKSIAQFDEYMQTLQDSRGENLVLDYEPFRELAHKNLGVARNLRIKDAEKLLYELMKKDDLEYLMLCLRALRECAIKLRPKCAYDTLKLIEVKKAL
jgi:phosphopantetheine adenylyltransferase